MNDATDDPGSSDATAAAPEPSVGDTQAFKAFYMEEPAAAAPKPTLLERILGIFRRG